MKILQVIPGFWVGGAEVMCKNLTLTLHKLGHQVSVVSLYPERTPIAEEIEDAGVKITYLDKQLGLDLSMIPKLRKIMEQEKPDAVHTHLDVIKYAAAAAKLAGVKVCLHTMHSLAEKECEGKLQKLINTVYFRMGLSTPVALSLEIRDSVAAFYGLKKETIPVIRNGIDLSRCIPKEDYATGETVTLLHVGRFDVPKNHQGMLRAFRRLHDRCPQCRLVLVGDGDLRPQIEETVEKLNLNDLVMLAGMQKNVYPYLHNADIFILPSIYEGNPMSIIEAMGTGLPIAASRVGGIPDMVEDEKTALLTDCDEAKFATAWERLVTDEALRARLGTNAKAASIRFSAGHMAGEYLKLYGKE